LTRYLLVLYLALNLGVTVVDAWAQQSHAPPIVGLMSFAAASDDPFHEAFRKALRELGYVEGRSIRIEFRTAQGHADRLERLAEELIQLKASVVVTGGSRTAQAVKRVNSNIPIVVTSGDPIASGLVSNLARPGGSVTGLSTMTTELTAKRLQLLKETVPRLTRLGVLWNPTDSMSPFYLKVINDLKAAADSMAIDLKIVRAATPEQFSSAIADASRSDVQALYLVENPIFYAHRRTLARLALQARLPTIYGTRVFAEDGGLMSYGANYIDLARRAARYVDRILRGAKPGDLPIEQATALEFVLNAKTAKALGLTIPQSLLERADEVIR
jgi:putative tryptophan/tyrosine transport system substrate-binding protein